MTELHEGEYWLIECHEAATLKKVLIVQVLENAVLVRPQALRWYETEGFDEWVARDRVRFVQRVPE